MKDFILYGGWRLLFITFFFPLFGFGQYSFYASNGSAGSLIVSGTQTVNNYYPVTAMSSGPNQVTIAGSYIPADSDMIMLIQVTGANAGTWQWARVTTGGNPFTVAVQTQSAYNNINPANGAVQAITVPQYLSLEIPAGAILTAQPWNGATGGILSFTVAGTFTIDPGGLCDVSGLGFSSDSGSVGGVGGAGGYGGAVSYSGGNYPPSAYAGAGLPALGGEYGDIGDTSLIPGIVGCPSCRDTASAGGTNTSNLNGGITVASIQLGGAGQPGSGGDGGIGGGGGGGGNFTPGGNGAAGGNGGSGGTGGKGGGAIVFLADTMVIPHQDTVFKAVGLPGTSGLNGTNGGVGGYGGTDTTTCNGGQGGAGANGGDGGNGGGGGGGGAVYALVNTPCINFDSTTVQSNGGLGAAGGTGGTGGIAGPNGGSPASCGGSPMQSQANGLNGANGNPGANGDDGTVGGSSGGGGAVVMNDLRCNMYVNFSPVPVSMGCPIDLAQMISVTYATGQVQIVDNGADSQYCSGTVQNLQEAFTVSDGNGCSYSGSRQIQVYEEPFFVSSTILTPTSCPDATNGTCRFILPWGGSCGSWQWNIAVYGPNGYSYSLGDAGYNPLPPNSPADDEAAITGLAPGTYFYQVFSGVTCTGITDTGSFMIEAGTGLPQGILATTICGGYSYVYNGHTYTQPGIYIDTLLGAGSGGCDSVVTQTLTVSPLPSQVNLSDTICYGQSYQLGGQAYTASGIYNVTLPGTYGCDTPVVLTLTVTPPPVQDIYDTICQGLSSQQGGNTYTSTGDYTDTIQDISGCDVISILHLWVNPPVTQNNTATICQGQSYQQGNNYYASSGIYTDTVFDPSGCMQIQMVNLTVTPPYSQTNYVTICQGQSYQQGFHTYTTGGTYVDTISDPSGCTEIATLYLSVTPPSAQTVSATICQGQSYQQGGYTYTTSGTYTNTIQDPSGCDVISTVQLTVTPPSAQTVSATICQGQSYQQGGYTYTTSGTYTNTIQDPSGCDVISTVQLTVTPPSVQSVSATICQGQSYQQGNSIYTVSGTYIDTIPDPSGCNVIYTLHLTVTPPTTQSVSATICQGQSYQQGNSTYIATGIYTDTVQNSSGCNVISILHLTVNNTVSHNISATICQGDIYDFDGQSLNLAGLYTDTLQSASGCDSIVVLHLNVSPISGSVSNVNICGGQTYTLGGHVYASGGQYIDTLTNATGCDSIVTLNLAVYPSSFQNITATVCSGQSYNLGYHSYNASGTYTDTLQNASGCDSVVTLTLTVLPLDTQNVNAYICSGQFYSFGGQVYVSNGIYHDTLQSLRGCDSIVTLDLTVYQPASQSVTASICTGQSYAFGSGVYSANGTYYDTLQSVVTGCDSIVSLILTVASTVNINMYDTICNGDTYPWYGSNYSVQGTYIDTILSTGSCDTVLFLNLYVNPIVQTHLLDTIQMGQSISIGNHSYNQSGTYEDTLISIHGCDSLVYLDLYVQQPGTIVVQVLDTICQGSSITLYGHMYTVAGSYMDTISVASGGDTIISLHLTDYPALASTFLYDTICPGVVIHFDNMSISQSGTYTDTLTGAHGCDSIVSMVVSLYPVTNTGIFDTIAAGQTVTVAGHTYTQTGVYQDTLTGMHGCDSIIYLDLIVRNSIVTNLLYDTICGGTSFILDGHNYTTTGVYDDTVTGISADTISILHLVVRPLATVDVYDTICADSSVTIGAHTYSQTGTYIDTLAGHYGCDSLVDLHLYAIPPISSSVTLYISHGLIASGFQTDTFRAIASNCSNPVYTWYENATVLSSLHDSIAVIVVDLSVEDSISCRIECSGGSGCNLPSSAFSNAINVTGINIVTENNIRIYPNPVSSSFIFESTGLQGEVLTIYDVLGRVVVIQPIKSNRQAVFLDRVSDGIYTAVIKDAEMRVIVRH